MTDTSRLAPGAWTFTGFGPSFDAHAAAHLPGYDSVQAVVAAVSSFTLPDGGVVADLGASTGRTMEGILDRHPDRRVEAHLYDVDASMLEEAAERLAARGRLTAHYHHGDLTQTETWAHVEADLTVALWLLQFVPPRHRIQVLAKARARAAQDGAILLAVKARHGDPRWQEVADAALADHKAAAGVTPQEAAAKTASLRGVLIPDTVTSTAFALERAGWHSPTVLWRWHVWTLIGAWASPVTDRPL